MIESALKNIHIDDNFLRYILTASNLNQALYLLLDNTLWLNSIGVIELKNKEKLDNYSNKFWMFSTLLSLARDINDLIGIIIQNEELIKNHEFDFSINRYTLNKTSGAYTSNFKKANSMTFKKIVLRLFKITMMCFNKKYHSLLLDTIKNIFDIVLPMSNLKFLNVSPGIEGLCGLVSSMISLIILWNSKFKLKN